VRPERGWRKDKQTRQNREWSCQGSYSAYREQRQRHYFFSAFRIFFGFCFRV